MSLWMCRACHSLQGFSKDLRCFACNGELEIAFVKNQIADADEAAIVSLQAPWKELGKLLRFGTDDPYVLIGAVQALLTERPTAAASRSFAVDPADGESTE